MYKSVSLLLILFAFKSHAQSPSWQWAKSSMGSGIGQKSANSITTDASGNIYVTGSFSTPTVTFGAITLTNHSNLGDNDVFLVKYNVSGVVIWAKNFGAESSESGNAIATDILGNVYVTGHFFSHAIAFDSIMLTNQGPTTGWLHAQDFLTKFDAAGNAVWAKTSSATYDSEAGATDVVTDAAGNIYQSGYFWSPSISFGATTLINSGPSGATNDVFVVKYDPTGGVCWARSAGGGSKDMCYSMASDGMGNIFVTGKSESTVCAFGSILLTNSGQQDAFLAKYDAATGNEVWARGLGGTNLDVGRSVCGDGFGNIYITGYFLSPVLTCGSIALVNSDSTRPKLFLAKFDSNGNSLWAQSAVGAGAGGQRVAIDTSGNINIVGFFTDTITLGPTTFVPNYNPNNVGYYSIFLAQYSTSGNLVMATSVGSNGDCFAEDMTIAGTGNLYITGSFFSPSLNVGSYTLTNTTAGLGGEAFVAKSVGNSIDGIALTASYSNESRAFPNPALAEITVILNETIGGTQICVHDVFGRVVTQPFITRGKAVVIQTSQFRPGAYLICLTDMVNGEKRTIKFLKE